MKTATSIKLDAVKKEAGKLASQMGLNLSAVVNATLKKFVIERHVVFSVAPEFNKKTREKFLEMRQDVKRHKNLSRVYTHGRQKRRCWDNSWRFDSIRILKKLCKSSPERFKRIFEKLGVFS